MTHLNRLHFIKLAVEVKRNESRLLECADGVNTVSLDDYLLNQVIIECKGRDLSDTRIKRNQILKLWVWDLTSYNEDLFNSVSHIYHS